MSLPWPSGMVMKHQGSHTRILIEAHRSNMCLLLKRSEVDVRERPSNLDSEGTFVVCNSLCVHVHVAAALRALHISIL